MKSIFYKIFLKLGFALIKIALKRTPKIKMSSTEMEFRLKVVKWYLQPDFNIDSINNRCGDDAVFVFDKIDHKEGVDKK